MADKRKPTAKSNVKATVASKKTTSIPRTVKEDIATSVSPNVNSQLLNNSDEKLLLYSFAIDEAPDGIQIADLNGRIIYSNKAVQRIYGYSPDEYYGKHVNEMNADPEFAGKNILPSINKTGRWAGELEVKHKDGRTFPIWLTTSLISNSRKEPMAMIGIIRDITERKHWEDRLKKINNVILNLNEYDYVGNLNALTALCGELLGADCTLYNRLDKNLLCVKGQWSEPADLKKEDSPQGHICFDVISRDSDQPLVVRNLQDTAYAKTDPNVTAYGLLTYIGCRVRYGGNARGSLCAVFSRDYEPSSNDLDMISTIAIAIAQEEERHEAMEHLQQSEEFIRSILDTVDEGFIVVDRDYRIITVNKAYCSQVGGCDAKIIGRYCYEISHKINRPCYEQGEECAVRQVFETGGPHASLHRHKDANDNILYVETKAYPVRDASGVVTSVIETINNITEKYLLEEERLKTQKLESIGILAGGIAHDFNNLLQGVFGYISMAKMNHDNKEKSLTMLNQAEEALQMTVNLTTQLLTFSKGGKPAKKLIRLEPTIENALKFALSGSQTDYRLDIAPDLWNVEADSGQLAQVIQNIVLNANEAMAGKGTATVAVRNLEIPKHTNHRLPEGGPFVKIDIQDTGTGISEQHLAKIFDPYFTTKQKGSGLGLATSYSIIRNHGGVIEVSSELNRGTTFTIYLPAAKGVETKAKVTSVTTAGTKKGRILLMDDEDLVRYVAGEMITALGHEVQSAEDGAKAIELFKNARESGKPFDLLILDLTVKGGMGGEETIKKILGIDPDVKAVVSSGYADSLIIANCRAHGFSACLNKPYQIAALKNCINKLLF